MRDTACFRALCALFRPGCLFYRVCYFVNLRRRDKGVVAHDLGASAAVALFRIVIIDYNIMADMVGFWSCGVGSSTVLVVRNGLIPVLYDTLQGFLS